MCLSSFLCSRLDLSHGNLPTAKTPGKMIRHILSSLALLAVAYTLATATATAQSNPKHFFWAPNQPSTPNPSSLANDLIYHGGNAGQGAIGVENKPATYLIFWGPDWINRFTTTDANGQVFSSQQLQNYVISFLANLGGTSWAAIPTESRAIQHSESLFYPVPLPLGKRLLPTIRFPFRSGRGYSQQSGSPSRSGRG